MRTDNLTKEQRSYCMSKIKSARTKPELAAKRMFKGLIFQPVLFGRPDFIDYKNQTVIFIDGCFWHNCPIHFIKPKSNKSYWLKKIKRNVLRDREITLAYQNANWCVIRIWEHELKI